MVIRNRKSKWKEKWVIRIVLGFPGGSVNKEPIGNVGDAGRCRFDPWIGRSLEEMATHSTILAWRIPWIEEPGGLQSMGS